MKIVVNNKNFDSGKITEEKYDILDESMDNIDLSDSRARLTFSKAERTLMKEVIVAYFNNQFTVEELMKDRTMDDLIFIYIKLVSDLNEKMNKKVEKYQKNSKVGK